MTRSRLAAILLAAGIAWMAQGGLAIQARQARPSPPQTDLDAFMARVLERRNENWKTLHDYILSERESFRILGPGGVPLVGQRREFNWFIRDGYLVRSPVKANGATLKEDERRKYESNWLADEKRREEKARERAKEHASKKGRRRIRPRRPPRRRWSRRSARSSRAPTRKSSTWSAASPASSPRPTS